MAERALESPGLTVGVSSSGDSSNRSSTTIRMPNMRSRRLCAILLSATSITSLKTRIRGIRSPDFGCRTLHDLPLSCTCGDHANGNRRANTSYPPCRAKIRTVHGNVLRSALTSAVKLFSNTSGPVVCMAAVMMEKETETVCGRGLLARIASNILCSGNDATNLLMYTGWFRMSARIW